MDKDSVATITFDAGESATSLMLKMRNAFELLTERLTCMESLIVAHRSESNEGLKSLRSEIADIRNVLSNQHLQPLDTSIFNQPIHETEKPIHETEKPIHEKEKPVTAPQTANDHELTPTRASQLSETDIDSLLKLPICSPSTKDVKEKEGPTEDDFEFPISGISARRQMPNLPPKKPERKVVYNYEITTDGEQSLIPTDQSDNDSETETDQEDNTEGMNTENDLNGSNASFKTCDEQSVDSGELDKAVETVMEEEDSTEECKHCGQSECTCVDDEFDEEDDLVSVFKKNLSKSLNASSSSTNKPDSSVFSQSIESSNVDKPSVSAQPIESSNVEKPSVFSQQIEATNVEEPSVFSHPIEATNVEEPSVFSHPIEATNVEESSVFSHPIEATNVEKPSVFSQPIETPEISKPTEVTPKRSPFKTSGNILDFKSSSMGQSKESSPASSNPFKTSPGTSLFGKPAFGMAPKTFSDLKGDAPEFLKKFNTGEDPFAVNPKEHKLFSTPSPSTSNNVSTSTFSPKAAANTSNQSTGLEPHVTGEEGETVWLETRCKLFQFFSKADVRERGVGDLKLLESPQTGAMRCVMRREKVHKVCANFKITPKFVVGTSQVGKHILTWSCMDFSDPEKSEGESTTFICQFIDEETANVFKKLVNNHE